MADHHDGNHYVRDVLGLVRAHRVNVDGYLLRTRLLALPTADSYRRGQFILIENPSVADDVLHIGIKKTDGSYAFKELAYGPISTPSIIVQEGDSTVESALGTLDFDAAAFNVTSSPAGEANVSLAYGTTSGTPAEGNHTHFIPVVRLFFNDAGASTSSTVTYTTVVSGTVVLPAGTWTFELNGWGRLGHSADGLSDIRVQIGASSGTAVTRSGPSVGAMPAGAAHTLSGVASGSVSVTMQARSNTAGDTTMTNCHLIANAYRTA